MLGTGLSLSIFLHCSLGVFPETVFHIVCDHFGEWRGSGGVLAVWVKALHALDPPHHHHHLTRFPSHRNQNTWFHTGFGWIVCLACAYVTSCTEEGILGCPSEGKGHDMSKRDEWLTDPYYLLGKNALGIPALLAH